ncbi:Cathepsin L [Holothuria leucospilota]|uniref:Cathepsin L n=1 Tax=Holothuria leucospilota TaxID=206669 RepID=A0A9Q1C174_HOLLE|nr:Cathepsin L [Holothuria leucospilota]
MLKAAIFLTCVATALCFSITAKEFDETWEMWKNTHSKQYSKDEEMNRRLIWEENLQKVSKHNAEHSLGLHSYTLGMNKYADLRHEEFVSMMNGFKYNASKERKGITFLRYDAMGVPDAIDWREKGYVTPVKDQGQCVSSWAFSTTGSLEGQHFRQTGNLVSLSEQNLVDCVRDYGNKGCEGGFIENAFTYIKNNDGIDTEDGYPYKAQSDTCRYQPSSKGATDSGYVDIPSGDEDALKEACGANGPISVAIDASHESFQLYEDGVYNELSCSTTEVDHAVLVVGYGTDDASGADYWIVKNSWGVSWGQEGYILMSRNKSNQCGIATVASYPTCPC